MIGRRPPSGPASPSKGALAAPSDESANLEPVAQRLSGALSASAEGVEPRPDAYARLATRVVVEVPDSRLATGSRWSRRSPRLVLGLSLALVAVAGVALVAPRVAGRNDTVATLVVGGLASEGAGAGRYGNGPFDAASPASSALLPSSVADARSRTQTRTWSDKTAAVTAFLDLMGIDAIGRPSWAASQVGGDKAKVRATVRGSRAEGEVTVTLELARIGAGTPSEGWVVTGAFDRRLGIGTLVVDGRPVTGSDLAVSGAALTVSGRAADTDRTVQLELRSATTGRVLARASAPVGDQPEPDGFAGAMPLVGTDQAWAVAWVPPVGAESEGRLAARLVSFDGAPDPTTYLVTRITATDAGLRLRRDPSMGDNVIEVLAPGAAVARQSGLAPVVVDGTVWWPVSTPHSSGWAAARYLSARPQEGTDQLRALVRQLFETAASPDHAGSWLPVSQPFPLPLFVDGVRVNLDPSQLSSSEGWNKADIPVGPITCSLVDLLQASEQGSEVDVRADGSGRFVDPAMESLAQHTFGGLSAVTADYIGTDRRHHRLHVYFEGSGDGPQMAGIMAETERS